MNLIKVGQVAHIVLGALAVGGASLAAAGVSTKVTAISGAASAACAAMAVYIGRYLPSVSPQVNQAACPACNAKLLASAVTEK